MVDSSAKIRKDGKIVITERAIQFSYNLIYLSKITELTVSNFV